ANQLNPAHAPPNNVAHPQALTARPEPGKPPTLLAKRPPPKVNPKGTPPPKDKDHEPEGGRWTPVTGNRLSLNSPATCQHFGRSWRTFESAYRSSIRNTLPLTGQPASTVNPSSRAALLNRGSRQRISRL